jgi:hypothetical protein
LKIEALYKLDSRHIMAAIAPDAWSAQWSSGNVRGTEC